MLVLAAIAIVCCAGLPLLLGGAGLTVLAALKGGPAWAILVAATVVGALVAIYGYRSRGSNAK
ncbi:MAG: hypothetical protein NVSMB31_05640 [Vulcanimicrobiaceae bacterium]